MTSILTTVFYRQLFADTIECIAFMCYRISQSDRFLWPISTVLFVVFPLGREQDIVVAGFSTLRFGLI